MLKYWWIYGWQVLSYLTSEIETHDVRSYFAKSYFQPLCLNAFFTTKFSFLHVSEKIQISTLCIHNFINSTSQTRAFVDLILLAFNSRYNVILASGLHTRRVCACESLHVSSRYLTWSAIWLLVNAKKTTTTWSLF